MKVHLWNPKHPLEIEKIIFFFFRRNIWRQSIAMLLSCALNVLRCAVQLTLWLVIWSSCMKGTKYVTYVGKDSGANWFWTVTSSISTQLTRRSHSNASESCCLVSYLLIFPQTALLWIYLSLPLQLLSQGLLNDPQASNPFSSSLWWASLQMSILWSGL
jgi:hypothetical protein